jgi:leader peptidase (prepilin peptidase)/N-methyltransferase
VTELLVLVAAGMGGALGFGADRLAVRWPEHEVGYQPRRPGWRTAVVAGAGALIFAGLVQRWHDPRDVLLLGIFAAVLVVLLATDLDQRMLPNVLTMPLIGYAAVLLVLGLSPLLAGRELALFSGIAAGVGAPLLLLLSDRLLRGDLGGGDLWLAISIGLLAGVTRMFLGFLVASVGFALVLIVLMLLGRLGRRSHVPFGPVLIGAAFAAMLLA